MGTKEEVTKRFEELIKQGQGLIGTLGPAVSIIHADGRTEFDQKSYEYWIPQKRIPEFRSWLTSAVNLIHYVAPPEAHIAKECDRFLADDDLKRGVTSSVLVQMLGLLTGAKDEWEQGLFGKIEYIVAGATFDDFLDHAAEYHKGNRKIESSVLASAVLEDTVKKIAHKNGLSTENKTLYPLIDELVKANVFTPVKAKRVRSFAGVRNHALHAEWDKFDISDVGAMIKGIRELIEELL